MIALGGGVQLAHAQAAGATLGGSASATGSAQAGGDSLAGMDSGGTADASATPPPADTSATPQESGDVALEPSSGGSLFDMHAYSLRVGVDSAGPVYFKDIPNEKLESTNAFEYGGHLAFLLGDDAGDPHRLGLGVAWNRVASSESRALSFLTPHLVYETGTRLQLQGQLGGSIGLGTKGYASKYAGVYTGLSLRYSFRDEQRRSPFWFTPAIVGLATLAPSSIKYSTFFLGAQLEFAYQIK